MANEELHQRGYFSHGKLKGKKYGEFEELNIGCTHIKELRAAGVEITIPSKINFPFSAYKPPIKPENVRPDK